MPTAPNESPIGVFHHTDSAVDTPAEVRSCYGRVLAASVDLKTSACCAGDTAPPHLRQLIADVPIRAFELARQDRCSSVSDAAAAPCC